MVVPERLAWVWLTLLRVILSAQGLDEPAWPHESAFVVLFGRAECVRLALLGSVWQSPSPTHASMTSAVWKVNC